ncbi:hypothetical protein RRG08_045585 [Elysia crispata]|uniref:Uncharacterized protein n=1 Tax=Elysia crispata TaxID=231223 RepID=A0AAE1AD02_9GAST|nr:hypothetical protein RRG08_045585 [Elysia crispata]
MASLLAGGSLCKADRPSQCRPSLSSPHEDDLNLRRITKSSRYKDSGILQRLTETALEHQVPCNSLLLVCNSYIAAGKRNGETIWVRELENLLGARRLRASSETWTTVRILSTLLVTCDIVGSESQPRASTATLSYDQPQVPSGLLSVSSRDVAKVQAGCPQKLVSSTWSSRYLGSWKISCGTTRRLPTSRLQPALAPLSKSLYLLPISCSGISKHAGVSSSEHDCLVESLAENLGEGGGDCLVESLAENLGEGGGDCLVESLAENLGEGGGDCLVESLAENLGEGGGDCLVESLAENLGEGGGDCLVESLAENLGEGGGDCLVESLAENLGEGGGDCLVESLAENLGEGGGDCLVESLAENLGEGGGDRLVESLAENLGEGGGDCLVESLAENLGEGGGDCLVESLAENLGEGGGDCLVESLAENLGEGGGDCLVESLAENLGEGGDSVQHLSLPRFEPQTQLSKTEKAEHFRY